MATVYALYNPLAANGLGKENSESVKQFYPEDEVIFRNLCEISDFSAFFSSISEDAPVVLCGGDGTINRFVNATIDISYPNPIYFYGAGTGNDFLRDVGVEKGGAPIRIDQYIKDLPIVCVNGKEYRFLNNVGFGIDGYCCEEGDRQRAKGKTKINYTMIAIMGLLFHYRPTDATVIVDGKEYRFEKAWLCPTMHGRYYGGGMNAAPKQDRLDPEGKLSVMLMHGYGKLKTLITFPSIFKGKSDRSHVVL